MIKTLRITMATRKPTLTDQRQKDALLNAVLGHVPFDGWSTAAFAAGTKDLDLTAERARLLFPRGLADLAQYFGDSVAAQLEAELEGLAAREPSIRRRIALGVRHLILLLAPHREAVRRLPPPHNPAAALYRITDVIWRAAGDQSTDYNFYTKRGLLAGVVTATYLYWLDDESDDFADTWAFLDRRIEDVLRIQMIRGRLEKAGKRLGVPLDAWRKSPLGRIIRAQAR
jgi:ubiquinone biosynthesis protein COQ9